MSLLSFFKRSVFPFRYNSIKYQKTRIPAHSDNGGEKPGENPPDGKDLYDLYYEKVYRRLEEPKRLEFEESLSDINELIEATRKTDQRLFKHFLRLRHRILRLLYDDISSDKSSDSAKDKLDVGKVIMEALDRDSYRDLLEWAGDESEKFTFAKKFPEVAEILVQARESDPAAYMFFLEFRWDWIYKNRLNPPKENKDPGEDSDGEDKSD